MQVNREALLQPGAHGQRALPACPSPMSRTDIADIGLTNETAVPPLTAALIELAHHNSKRTLHQAARAGRGSRRSERRLITPRPGAGSRQEPLKSRPQRSEVINKVKDLPLVQLKLGHGVVTYSHPLPKGFLQAFNRVTLVESSERWGVGQGAIAHGCDGMTASAMCLRKGFAALSRGLVRLRRPRHQESTDYEC